MEDKVLSFIEKIREFDKDGSIGELFTKGFCYYFAVILQERFGGEILYEPIDGHFYCRTDGGIYDYGGEKTDYLCGETLMEKSEWMLRKSIVEGCLLKIEESIDITDNT